MLFSHLEVLTEVLVTAPPVEVHHSESLCSSNLMEVGVSDIVLDTIDWHSSVSVTHGMVFISISNSISPVLHHFLLSKLLIEVETE